MIKHLRVISVIGVISPLIAYTLWPLKFMDWNDGMIDQGWAICYLCLNFVIWKSVKDIWIRFIGKIGFWFAVNNLLDEFLFNPIEANYTEYLYAVIVLIVTSLEARKKIKQWQRQNRNKSVSL